MQKKGKRDVKGGGEGYKRKVRSNAKWGRGRDAQEWEGIQNGAGEGCKRVKMIQNCEREGMQNG